MEQLYVVGHPLAHSKSPAMYNAIYPALGLDWVYEVADYADETQARSFIEAADFLSINITKPYKPLAYQLARRRDASAVLAQGANLLVRFDVQDHTAGLCAFNTDGEGCIRDLLHRGAVFENAHVVVCGTGPTALAIMHAAAMAGATTVHLCGRSTQRVGQALDHYRTSLEGMVRAGECQAACSAYSRTLADLVSCDPFSVSDYEGAREALHNADTIIDATPLGMGPDDPAPFDVSILHKGQLVYDCVYGHGTSELVAAASVAGCRAFNGEGMLVSQAIATVRIVCATVGLEPNMSDAEMFGIMARAAGFKK